MLKQPMIEKLAGMRLLGMVEALKAQKQDPSARELSFLEGFGLLVDQQWNWRENQALSRRLAKFLPPESLFLVYSEENGPGGIMRSLLVALAVQAVIGVASAALKPIETDVHPTDNKAVVTYKTTPQGDLKLNLYFPRNWNANDKRPIIVFFFAGSCATGSPAQFAATAEYFATRGLVATVPEYRTESVHHTPPERCIEDGKSAIRWLRINARHLGIDARRVIAGGGSSGATMAAFTAYNTVFVPDDEERSISSEPEALVLLNPAFGCPPGESSEAATCAVLARWKVTKGGPPAILFYGTEDPLQDGGREFARQLMAAGTRAEFYTASGQQHGFFNRFPDSPWHALVLRQIDLFLASLGYLKGDPVVGIPANTTVVLRKDRL